MSSYEVGIGYNVAMGGIDIYHNLFMYLFTFFLTIIHSYLNLFNMEIKCLENFKFDCIVCEC